MRPGRKRALYYGLSILMAFCLAVLYFAIGQAIFFGRALEGEISLSLVWVATIALVVMRRYKVLAWLNVALFIAIFIFILLPEEYPDGGWVTALILVMAWAATQILVLAITFLGRRSQLDPNIAAPK